VFVNNSVLMNMKCRSNALGFHVELCSVMHVISSRMSVHTASHLLSTSNLHCYSHYYSSVLDPVCERCVENRILEISL
jgi:hypothetical protein